MVPLLLGQHVAPTGLVANVPLGGCWLKNATDLVRNCSTLLINSALLSATVVYLRNLTCFPPLPMKKSLLLALLLAGAAEESYPAAAAPAASTAVAGSPTRMERTRRRLHRQSAQRIRRNKRRLGFGV